MASPTETAVPVSGVRTWSVKPEPEDDFEWPDMPCAPCDDPYEHEEHEEGREPAAAAAGAGAIARRDRDRR